MRHNTRVVLERDECTIEKDLEDLGAQNWREIIQYRDKWNDLVTAAKPLRKL